MQLDCRKFPKDYTFTQEVSRDLCLYVKVAGFVEHKGTRIFRMIVDPIMDFNQLYELLNSSVKDENKTYYFSFIETITAPVVDEVSHKKENETYIRITFQ